MNGYGKGYDTLLKICEQSPKIFGVYIIGDEPIEEILKYYQAADLSVFPSRGEAWGLVVNESMANGVPVIATDVCVAALELIENDKNGFIVSVDVANINKEIIL